MFGCYVFWESCTYCCVCYEYTCIIWVGGMMLLVSIWYFSLSAFKFHVISGILSQTLQWKRRRCTKTELYSGVFFLSIERCHKYDTIRWWEWNCKRVNYEVGLISDYAEAHIMMCQAFLMKSWNEKYVIWYKAFHNYINLDQNLHPHHCKCIWSNDLYALALEMCSVVQLLL